MKALLNARSYYYQKKDDVWVKDTEGKKYVLKIASDIFENGHLKYLRPQEWTDDYVKKETIDKQEGVDDLPF